MLHIIMWPAAEGKPAWRAETARQQEQAATQTQQMQLSVAKFARTEKRERSSTPVQAVNSTTMYHQALAGGLILAASRRCNTWAAAQHKHLKQRTAPGRERVDNGYRCYKCSNDAWHGCTAASRLPTITKGCLARSDMCCSLQRFVCVVWHLLTTAATNHIRQHHCMLCPVMLPPRKPLPHLRRSSIAQAARAC
jgi:hypothetical protein